MGKEKIGYDNVAVKVVQGNLLSELIGEADIAGFMPDRIRYFLTVFHLGDDGINIVPFRHMDRILAESICDKIPSYR